MLPALRVEPMTRGRFARRVAVVARSGELGDLPTLTATLARDVLRTQTFPPLIAALPWVEDMIGWP